MSYALHPEKTSNCSFVFISKTKPNIQTFIPDFISQVNRYHISNILLKWYGPTVALNRQQFGRVFFDLLSQNSCRYCRSFGERVCKEHPKSFFKEILSFLLVDGELPEDSDNEIESEEDLEYNNKILRLICDLENLFCKEHFETIGSN